MALSVVGSIIWLCLVAYLASKVREANRHTEAAIEQFHDLNRITEELMDECKIRGEMIKDLMAQIEKESKTVIRTEN